MPHIGSAIHRDNSKDFFGVCDCHLRKASAISAHEFKQSHTCDRLSWIDRCPFCFGHRVFEWRTSNCVNSR
ncbi:hypothetical protein FHT76_006615 [Rhizobium sp. BK176]|nr:hypothetical protein [Rhizobium sp. BK181]MCS4094906.1 hypothetical protein [Rhizobium sp. BK176]